FQPINKTIGINKLGTLLSSQTTDTNRHHPHPKGSKIAPEQLFKLTGCIPCGQIGKTDLIFPCGFLSVCGLNQWSSAGTNYTHTLPPLAKPRW
ncbi:hypothetical protein, partial [Paenarthrobacter ilicis]|uniref:hypothetical protein n=1 Tax=Paenarthrobacter ilicis TaxID=43665 RepID=UPI001ABB5DDC